MSDLIKKFTSKYRDMPVQVKASMWFFICSFLQRGIASLSTMIFTRLLSPADYGRYSAFVTWHDMLGTIIILYLPWGVYEQGYIKKNTLDEKEHFTSVLMGLMTALCLFWLGIYFLFRPYFNSFLELTTFQIICMFIMIWTSSIYCFWSIKQRIAYKYRRMAVLTLTGAILQPVSGIFFVINAKDDKVTARILSITIVSVVLYAGLFFAQMKKKPVLVDIDTWKYAFKFNIALLPHYLSQNVLSSSDKLMIKKMVGDSEVGIYSLAYSVSMIMTIFNTSLTNTITPWVMTKMKEKKVADIKTVIYPAIGFIAVVNMLLIILAPEVIRIFAPADYGAAIYAIPPVVMSVFFMFLYGIFSVFEMYHEKTKLISLATLLSALLNLVLNYIFIRAFGYIAAGYTTLICYIFYALFHYYNMRKICATEYPDEQILDPKLLLKVAVAFIAFGLLSIFTYSRLYLRVTLVAGIVLAIIIFRKRIVRFIRSISSLRKR